ncbi:MAG: hypothetical protein EZS28_000403 [Streblomastix strix]|uniref:ATPase dynein-related AAA domain-containing protein n=1 Tax=Streblomastix strix TaxID=222440 RepID=A0A5J4XAX7_9EUKA|nr:MAG: hypothetical protein EZS28_000403 [Streblomastix strix]
MRSAVLGIPLILRSIHLPPTSVIERLNSLLEDPLSLVVIEDIQQIFSDEKILKEVNQSKSRSVPINIGFSLAATTTETGRMSLSGPILSRFTNIVQQYILSHLNFIVVTNTERKPKLQCPLSLVHEGSSSGQQILKCKTSGISLRVGEKASIDFVKSIIWTGSAVDMADAILTAIVAKTITIFEGSPGRGKTIIAYKTKQDGVFTTQFVDSPLTYAMRLSADDTSDNDLPTQSILIDEMILAEPHLLEVIESFILEMGNSNRYLLPNGIEIEHKPIIIVATMNSAALSNAKSSLSTKLQGSSHFLTLIPFNKIELKALSESILTEPKNSNISPAALTKIMNAHNKASEILERETGTISERDSITLRELKRLYLFHVSCPNFRTDELIELVYTAQFNHNSSEQLLKEIDK